jgi:hypothetical protein
MAAGRRFGGYGKERRRMLREADVSADRRGQMIAEAFAGFKDLEVGRPVWDFERELRLLYEGAFSSLSGIPFKAEDVHRFSILLKARKESESAPPMMRHTNWPPLSRIPELPHDFKDSLFISALVNACEGQRCSIALPDTGRPLDYIAFMNRKELHVYGDAGRGFGMLMEKGSVTLHGDAGEDAAAMMMGGRMAIRGSAGRCLANGMKGGEVEVLGDAIESAALGLEGGRIVIGGNAAQGAGMDMSGGTLIILGEAKDMLGWGSTGGTIRLEGEYNPTGGTRLRTYMSQSLDPHYMESNEVGASLWHRGWPVRLVRPGPDTGPAR